MPGWLDHSFYSMPLPIGGISIDEGSVYIGVWWNDLVDVGFYVAADESPETPAQTGLVAASPSLRMLSMPGPLELT